MDYVKLKYLCKTAEVGSLRKATEVLNVTPGAISKALKCLDLEFGIKIFIHSHQGSSLTDDGARLYEQSKKLILDYENVRFSFGKKNPNEMYIKLGTYCFFTTFVLEEMMAEYLPTAQLLQLRLPPGELEKAILDKRVDIGLTFLPFPQSGIDVIPIAAFKMGVFTKLDAFKDIKFERIPFVASATEIHSSAYSIRNIDAWPYENFTRNIKYQVAGLESALGIARRGLAAIFCPNYIVELHNKIVSEKFHLFPVSLPRMLLPNASTVSLLKRSSMEENMTCRRLALYFRALCRNEICG